MGQWFRCISADTGVTAVAATPAVTAVTAMPAVTAPLAPLTKPTAVASSAHLAAAGTAWCSTAEHQH